MVEGEIEPLPSDQSVKYGQKVGCMYYLLSSKDAVSVVQGGPIVSY